MNALTLNISRFSQFPFFVALALMSMTLTQLNAMEPEQTIEDEIKSYFGESVLSKGQESVYNNAVHYAHAQKNREAFYDQSKKYIEEQACFFVAKHDKESIHNHFNGPLRLQDGESEYKNALRYAYGQRYQENIDYVLSKGQELVFINAARYAYAYIFNKEFFDHQNGKHVYGQACFFIAKNSQKSILDHFNGLRGLKAGESLYKNALRFAYAQRFQKNIDAVPCVEFLRDCNKYWINLMDEDVDFSTYYSHELLTKKYLQYTLLLLEPVLNQPVTDLRPDYNYACPPNFKVEKYYYNKSTGISRETCKKI